MLLEMIAEKPGMCYMLYLVLAHFVLHLIGPYTETEQL
jgi:hypothetical protein